MLVGRAAPSDGPFRSRFAADLLDRLIRIPARVLPGVPRVLTGVAAIVAMVAAIITALHSTAAGERTHQDGEACGKREAWHGMLRCGVGWGRFHGFVLSWCGFRQTWESERKGTFLSRARLGHLSKWKFFAGRRVYRSGPLLMKRRRKGKHNS